MLFIQRWWKFVICFSNSIVYYPPIVPTKINFQSKKLLIPKLLLEFYPKKVYTLCINKFKKLYLIIVILEC